MQIIIQHKNTLIADQVKVADTFWCRLKGWIGKEVIQHNEALVIRPCSSIHTFGMKATIDVLFLNSNNQVIHLLYNLRPNRISPLIRHAHTTIELREGTLQSLNIELWDLVLFATDRKIENIVAR